MIVRPGSQRVRRLSKRAVSLLRVLVSLGGSAPAEALLDALAVSWPQLLASLDSLTSRGLVRVRPGAVSITGDGRRVLKAVRS